MTQVIEGGICAGCGACLVDTPSGQTGMTEVRGMLVPDFDDYDGPVDGLFWEVCPGKGIDYPALYRSHYHALPEDWRLGMVDRLWIGHATDPKVRLAGASGGVTTAVLCYLLDSERVDAVVVVRQGIPSPERASYFVARTTDEILDCAQSIYIPVSMLDALRELEPGKRYAMTCVPEQSAALRALQHAGHPRAQQIRYVLGPYTGTALQSAAIRALLRSRGVAEDDEITSLQWRAGEWPGYLEISTASGKTIRSKKVYYNYLIPFFITQTSLQSMDFANEFTDLSIGDAWSPKFERLGQGFSVVLSRSEEMTTILEEMAARGLVDLTPEEPLAASAMHGHMIDFKKRGAYLRNRTRRTLGLAAPDYGLRPSAVGLPRVLVELVIMTIFALCRSSAARWLLQRVPEKVIGPLFNRLRLSWKAISKPAKRKDLRQLEMKVAIPEWREKCKP